MHFRVLLSPRLVCCDWPEGRILSCLHPPATQAIPAIRVRGSDISVQGPTLRAIPVASRLHQSCGGGPCVVCVLNYLDDWLILVQSHEQLFAYWELVLRHFGQLGLRVNWEKSKLVPMQRISFLSMELDSVNQTAHLTQERAQLVLNCLNTFLGRTVFPLKLLQRFLGHMAAAVEIVPLGPKTSQYLVWLPFASCSATHLLRIELIRLLIVACGMLVHSSSMAVQSYWILAGTGTCCRIHRSRASQTCSLGDISGKYAGHARTGMFSASRNCVQILATWAVHYHATTWGDGRGWKAQQWASGSRHGISMYSKCHQYL